MRTTLVVMAAGMGSRFGGLKQTAPVTDDGKGILDFTVSDAKRAGFDRVVFIIREDMADDFKRLVGNRIAKTIDVDYVYQDIKCLPEGRTKPFGTAHAIYCCRDKVKEPFAIVNADDYYGYNAFNKIHEHLTNAKRGEYAMTAYLLGNTLSKNGTVARGICEVKEGYLKSVLEVTKITSEATFDDGNKTVKFDLDTPVSMNLWGLTPDFFEVLDEEYPKFLSGAQDLLKDEFLVPEVIAKTIKEGLATVKVYKNEDRWYGITYREDLAEVKNAIAGFIDKGLYKDLT